MVTEINVHFGNVEHTNKQFLFFFFLNPRNIQIAWFPASIPDKVEAKCF